MENVKQYVVFACSHAQMRNTRKDRYRVAAKSAKQAEYFLQKALGCSHTNIYFEDKHPKLDMSCGKIVKEVWSKGQWLYQPVDHVVSYK